MADKEKIKDMFYKGATLEKIAREQQITRERVRQILNQLLFNETYQKQLLYNRRNRPHKTRAFTRICPVCGKEYSGREYIDKPMLLCKKCRWEKRRLARTKTYICQNCGVEKTYLDYKRKPVFCSRKCHGQWLYKMKINKSIFN